MTRLVLTTPGQHLLKDRMNRSQQEKDAERAARAENARLTEKYKYRSPGWKRIALIGAGFFVLFFMMALSVRKDDRESDINALIVCTTKLLERGAKIDFGTKTIVDLAWHPEEPALPIWHRIGLVPFCIVVALMLTTPIVAILWFTDKLKKRHNYLYVRAVTLQQKKDVEENQNDVYGFKMTHSGIVTKVTHGGPADGVIELGETVLAINGVRLLETFSESTVKELLEARDGCVELHVRVKN